MSRQYVEVSLPPPLGRELTYGVPADLVDVVVPGAAVLVPVQRRLVTGFVLGPAPPLSRDGLSGGQVRDLAQVLDAETSLSPEILQLCRWMADYYLAPLGSALAAALPPGVRSGSSRVVRLVGDPPPGTPAEEPGPDGRICRELGARGPLKTSSLRRLVGAAHLEPALRRLLRSGRVEIRPELALAGVSSKREQCVEPLDGAGADAAALQSRAPRQAALLALLRQRGTLAKRQLVDEGFSYQVVRGLEERGLARVVEREVLRDPLAHLVTAPPEPLALTADQVAVLEQILAAVQSREYYPALLQGVTGSGKTLVYIRAAEAVLAQGRSALILVPEIALAWQMVRRFKSHFGDQIAVMHSQLSAGERYDTWRRLRRGQQRIAIGARSAVLAPLADLGLVVVDEEQDSSYFQDDLEARQPVAYSARDLALVRGRYAGAVVLLGSATPSLETYWNARTGKYHLLSLPRRVDDRPLARVEVADMRQEPYQRRERALFSRALRLGIRARLERGEQVVLLQNRRGFAPMLQCKSCGEAVSCPSCRVSLTYHRQGEALRCHYCDHRQPVPTACPHCASAEVRLEGVGTQRVEAALEEQFPGIRVIRMDVDTTGWKGAHDELVERFRRGEADVLLGTQMVAKGLDFPEVTLVGVISADTGLHLPDFRAAERSFQLLTQVAGRSGRGRTPGEVVIQTLLPDSSVLQSAARQDYESFAEVELEERRASGFPPFGRLIVFRWRGPEEAAVEGAAAAGVDLLLRARAGDTAVLGPAPAPLARLRGRYRWQ
ncbi:MAG: primosomal protein N', partial [Gemmatimonadota bacterium]